MRIRPNSISIASTHYGRSNDLYRRFRLAFDFLVSLQNPAIARKEFDEWYVSVPDIETSLRESVAGDRDSMRFLLGNTGIGKSTILRRVFQVESKATVNGGNLVIPLSFNGRRPDSQSLLTALRATSRFLTSHYSITTQLNALHDFITDHRPDLLEMDSSLPDSADAEKRLYAFKNQYSLGYELERLKYVIYLSTLTNVTIIIDDIESLSAETQGLLIHDACKSFTCLQNLSKRNYSVNCLISCRPTTHALLRKQEWYSVYTFDDPIRIENCVDLNALFEARFKSAIKNTRLRENVGNQKELDRALDVVMCVSTQISNRFHISLNNFANHNVRDSLKYFQHVLTNRTWCQRGKVVNASFAVEESDYAINEVSVFRALALGEAKTYPVPDTPIINIFHNDSSEVSDLLITYVIRYLLFSRAAANEPGHFVSKKSVLCSDLSRNFPEIVGPNAIDFALDYMLGNGLLIAEDIGGHTIFSLTPRTLDLWKQLQSSSICLEFYVDDTYHDIPETEVMAFNNTYTSDELFLRTCNFLRWVSAVENDRMETSRQYNLLSDYIVSFGQATLARYLSHGMLRSIRAYYSKASPPGPPPKLRKKLNEYMTQVKRGEALATLGVKGGAETGQDPDIDGR